MSHRLHSLAGDSQLWKAAYYNRFVRPRALRIPGIRDENVPAASLYFSSKVSKWLEDDRFVKRGKDTNWKRQYKLRHNWSSGSCGVTEIQIAERPSTPPLLVNLHEDVAVTADVHHGLRAWTTSGVQRLLGSLPLHDGSSKTSSYHAAPTSLAIDVRKNTDDNFNIAVGFCDGSFGIYSFRMINEPLACIYKHATSINGVVSAIAFSSPYIVMMTEGQLLSLYRFRSQGKWPPSDVLNPPHLLSSLKSSNAWPPLSLSIRISSTSVVTSIAYALPTYLSGWSVGLQELRLTPEGSIVQSRLTCADIQGFIPLAASSGQVGPSSRVRSARSIIDENGGKRSLTRPSTLSYSHPYLLASHPDNTLTLYLVTSSEKELTIGEGSRLWGHTSSVSGAQVGDRGKAVSVSQYGDEIRVWQLEGGILSNGLKKRANTGEACVQVRPERIRGPMKSPEQSGKPDSLSNARLQEWLAQAPDELASTKSWVGFDEERVIVLRGKGQGAQSLVMYDFS